MAAAPPGCLLLALPALAPVLVVALGVALVAAAPRAAVVLPATPARGPPADAGAGVVLVVVVAMAVAVVRGAGGGMMPAGSVREALQRLGLMWSSRGRETVMAGGGWAAGGGVPGGNSSASRWLEPRRTGAHVHAQPLPLPALRSCPPPPAMAMPVQHAHAHSWACHGTAGSSCAPCPAHAPSVMAAPTQAHHRPSS